MGKEMFTAKGLMASRPPGRGLIHPALAREKKVAGPMGHRPAGKTTSKSKVGTVRIPQDYNLQSPTDLV